jgi:hypothetical protein
MTLLDFQVAQIAHHHDISEFDKLRRPVPFTRLAYLPPGAQRRPRIDSPIASTHKSRSRTRCRRVKET